MIDYNITTSVTTETLKTGRTYFTPDGAYPSITTLLGKTSSSQIWLQKWKDKVGEEEAARISKEATDRGTAVHEYLEKYWNGEDILGDLAREPANVRLPAKALINGTSRNVTEVWAQEIPVWSPTLKFAGRVDMIGLWNSIPSIIDFKTSKKVKKGKDIKDYFLQASGYAHAHNELFGTNIQKIVIIVAVDGEEEPLIFEQKAPVFIPELKSRIIAYYKLNDH
jgi:genome maintenance exonuclease 1